MEEKSLKMSARDDILASIRRSLHVNGQEAPRKAAVAARLSQAAPGILPERGALSGHALIELFITEALATFATVAEVKTDEIPAEVARYLRENNLPATLKIGADPRLAGLNWAQTLLNISHGRSDGHDLNGLSHAFGAAAETGTLILVSGAENPTTLNFLPDTHIVVVNTADIAGHYETVLKRIRTTFGAGEMPRTVNFITGPSRSGDIEQKLLLGAHGPRSLHIIIAGD
jgi:L-lactate dehydrogenase complex protein LldG